MKELLEYQNIDGQLKQIENEIVATDEFKKYRSAKSFLSNVEETLKKIDARAGEIITLLNNAKQQYAEIDARLEEYIGLADKSENLEETSYLKKKADQLRKSVDNLDKLIAQLQKEMKEVAATFDELGKRVPIAKKQYTENKAMVDNLKKEREGQVRKLKAELEKLEKNIDPKMLAYYNKLKQENVKKVVVPLLDGSRCGGCNMEMPLGAMSKLNATGVIICDNCRRIIYNARED
ncbi:MAG: C4-type zinc ribbon domain-containing protein [Clostridia bacterium]|nr:C4-type zinc ribbon domain-containing protein [Clostridia bacterium]